MPFPGRSPSAVLPEKELKQILRKKLVEDLPAPFPRYAASLAAVGFFDPEPGLEDKLTELYARQVAGFYDPEDKKFFIVPERTAEAAATAPALGVSAGTLLEDALLAHELTHALQDRRLDLVRRMKALKDSSDALLALEAFLEGEATVVMMDALLVELPPETKELFGKDTLSNMLSGLAAGTTNVEGSEGVPDFFVKEMLFPYVSGTAWIEAKRSGGAGWAAVDANYASPPATTAEILHPDRTRARAFLAPGDAPSGAEVPAGMRVLYADTFGEWMLATLLERAGAADAEGPGRRVAGRPHPLLRAETRRGRGAPRRVRLAHPHDFSRRRATPRGRARAALRARRKGLRSRPSRPVADRVEVVRGAAAGAEARQPPFRNLSAAGRKMKSWMASNVPCAAIGATTLPVRANATASTDVIASNPTKKNGSP